MFDAAFLRLLAEKTLKNDILVMKEIHRSDFPAATVTVVDDDSFSRELLTEILDDQGYGVETAASGQEAIESIEFSPSNLVLLDIKMPDMSGYEVCRRLKENPRTCNIPVIFVSSLDESVDKVKGFEVGGVDYVTKPIQLEEFLARVKTHIRLHQLTVRFENSHEEIKHLVEQRTEELAHANSALQQSESKFRHLFVHSPVSLWDIDYSEAKAFIERVMPKSLNDLGAYFSKHPNQARECIERIRVLDVNKAALKLFDAESNDALIGRLGETFTPSLIQALQSAMVWFWEGKTILETDASVKTLKGAYREIILRAQRILSEEHRSRYRVLVSVLDISDRKQAEDALRESENRYRMVMEASPDPIVVYDMQGRAVYVNPAFTRVFGWTYEEIAGSKIDYVPESAWPETQAMLQRIKRGESYFGFETQRYDKNRRTIDINMSFGVWKNRSGDPAGTVVILRDVTDQKKLATQLRQAQKMESIGTLAGGIAHDFNNILAAIIGYAELSIGHEIDNEKIKRYLEKILQSGNRAKDLVQQILSFSRTTDTGKSTVNITPVIKEALKLLRATIPTTIEIFEHLKAKIDRINGNTTEIHQILMNLCTNASFAMQQDGGILEVRLDNAVLESESAVGHFRLPPGDYLRMSVSDTGHGISQEHIEKIFDPYFTTKTKKDGTGMGLSIVHGIIKDYGGAIKVESQVDIGTKFEIFIPVSSEKRLLKEENFQTTYKGSGSILLVDDEENLVDAYGQMMETLGYQVTGSNCSNEALHTFRSEPQRFDLVLADYTMPNMTGAQLAAAILEIRPDIPVILYTGYAEDITSHQAKEIGVKAMISKPLNQTKLSNILHRYFRGSP